MEYVKQTFTKGQTLKAEHLNHIEEAVETLSQEQPKVAQIIDGSKYGPTLVYFNTSGITCTDVINWMRDINDTNPTVDRIVMNDDYTTSYRCIGSELIRNKDNTFNCKLLFGDDLAPIILDGPNNKILIDPDWVAPDVEVPITHCAFIKQNDEIMTGNIETFEEACKLLSNGANRFHASIAITAMQGDYLESETCHAISVRSCTDLTSGAIKSLRFYFESFHSGPFQVIWNSDGSLIETEY